VKSYDINAECAEHAEKSCEFFSAGFAVSAFDTICAACLSGVHVRETDRYSTIGAGRLPCLDWRRPFSVYSRAAHHFAIRAVQGPRLYPMADRETRRQRAAGSGRKQWVGALVLGVPIKPASGHQRW